MYTKKQAGLFLSTLLLLAACQSYDRSAHLWLVNTTDMPIHYWVTCDSSIGDLEFKNQNILKPHDSIMPYLLWGPEGKGPDNNTWVNAINRADDSALHVFCMYIDLKDDPDLSDSLFYLIIKRSAFKVDSLEKMHWRIEYR